MSKTLDIAAIFRNEAADLIRARDVALRTHPTDIRAAGNEVEAAVRDYLRRSLPRRYYVTHGHLIDRNANVSPQMDVIVADNEHLPTLLRMKDGTEYVPADGVYAVGEIKSTFSHSKRHVEEFAQKLASIDQDLTRPEIPNTAFGGLTGATKVADLSRPIHGPINNRLFSFMVCIDGGDFRFISERDALLQLPPRHSPGLIAILNQGVVVQGVLTDRLEYTAYPAEQKPGAKWIMLAPEPGELGSNEGGVLGFLYATLLHHLNRSHLGPVDVAQYLGQLLQVRRGGVSGLEFD